MRNRKGRNGFGILAMLSAAALALFIPAGKAQAAGPGTGTMQKGIFVENMDLSGKTQAEALAQIQEYVEGLKASVVTLQAGEGQSVQVTAGDLGLTWQNREIIEEAARLGKEGNIVERYKALKDLERENKVYPLTLTVDKNIVSQVLEEQCAGFNQEAADASLTRADGQFSVTPGKEGRIIDEAASAEAIYDRLTQGWDHQDCVIELIYTVDTPRGTSEELAKVRDVLGTFTTSYKSSGKARSANVENGCLLINGMTLYPGDEFSTYEAVAPFTAENGYYMAASYLSGQVVDSIGGGICQVSTTLYNAVLLSELEVTERHNHSMIVNYVSPSSDAAIAESAGKDFRFVNNTQSPIYIEGTASDRNITFTIYGEESRPANREVSYESEILSQTNPDSETLVADPGQGVGSLHIQSAHIGYKARLWKVVKEDGVQVSREQINSSSYKMVPRSATVGVSTPDPNVYNTLMAAIGTGSIDYVKSVVDALTTGQAVPAAPPAAPQDPAAQGQPVTPQDPAAQGQPAAPQDPAAQGQPAAPQDPAA